MMIDKSAGCPACSWVAVTDASGRVHMEARWSTADRAATTTGEARVHATAPATVAAAVPATAA